MNAVVVLIVNVGHSLSPPSHFMLVTGLILSTLKRFCHFKKMEKKSYLNSLETLILKRQKNDKKEKEKGLRKPLFLLALRR